MKLQSLDDEQIALAGESVTDQLAEISDDLAVLESALDPDLGPDLGPDFGPGFGPELASEPELALGPDLGRDGDRGLDVGSRLGG